MYRRKSVAVTLVFLSLISHDLIAEQSDDAALIQHRSQHIYNTVFGLPAVASRPVQTREWQVSLEHSNQFMGGVADDERLLIDGETSELVVRHRQRLGACVQLEVTFPFIQHSEGSFDDTIDDWHKVFGLPDAQRDTSPFFSLNYSYESADGVAPDVDRPQSGIGDVQLAIQRSLGCRATSDATAAEPIVRFGVKLPTGSVSELRGSGEFDLFVDYQSPVLTFGNRWKSGAAIGLLYVGDSPRFARQNTIVSYGTLGVQFVLSNRWRLLAQLDLHTPFYNSNLRELGDPAVSMSGGVRFLGPADQSIELTISEDAAIDTTPDIVARLAWTYRPPAGR